MRSAGGVDYLWYGYQERCYTSRLAARTKVLTYSDCRFYLFSQVAGRCAARVHVLSPSAGRVPPLLDRCRDARRPSI